MIEKAMSLMQEADSIDGMMANSMRSDAAIYAALAQAEALNRIAVALEKLTECISPGWGETDAALRVRSS